MVLSAYNANKVFNLDKYDYAFHFYLSNFIAEYIYVPKCI